MSVALSLVAAYLLGSIPTSLWVGKAAYGVDLRTKGSGNLGATNVYRVFGWKAAIPVFLFDVFKGWAPVAVLPALLVGAASPVYLGAAAIVGHVFSIWAGFRGGKGVATSAGVFLGLAPIPLVVGLVAWISGVALTRIVSVGSILAAIVLPVAVWFLPDSMASTPFGREVGIFTTAVALFVLWAHRANIRRLIAGEEPRIGTSRRTVEENA